MSSCHEFTNLVAIEIGLQHRQQFTNSYFHFLTVSSRQHPHCFFSAQTKDLSRGVNFQHDNSTPSTLENSEHPSYCLSSWSRIWNVADYPKMRKWEWLFVNGCECNSPVSPRPNFYIQDGAYRILLSCIHFELRLTTTVTAYGQKFVTPHLKNHVTLHDAT
jgi:hypothetical protein